MMNDKNIDELFRDKLKDLEKAPPAYLFDNVMAGISAMRRKRKLMYWRIGTVAAAILLAFVAGWQISEMNSQSNKQSVAVSKNSSVQTDESQNNKQETLSNEKDQLDAADNTAFSATNHTYNRRLASSNTIPGKSYADQPVSAAPIENAAPIAPVKTLEAQIEQKEQIANVLVEQKKEELLEDEITGPSVDEQIIRQNVQTMQARNERQRKNRWMVGAQVSPAINVNRSNHSSQYASNMLNPTSSATDLGAGLSVEYKPAKRWSVQSGVYYAGIAQTSGNKNTARYEDMTTGNKGLSYFNAPVNIESDKMMMNSTAGVIELKNIPTGMVVGTNLEDKSLSTAVVVSDAKFIQNFQYLEIPLYLRYNLVDARFDVELMGGVSSNVLVGNNTYMDSNSGKSQVGKTQDMQAMSYSSTLGLGLKYGLSKRIYLNLEPRVKYYLNSLNNNPAVDYKPYTIGVFTGISYSF